MFAQVELDPSYSATTGPTLVPLEGVRRATHEDFDRLEADVASDVISQALADDAPTVKIPFRGGYVLARPLDTRRFVRAMARHISFN